MEQSKFYQIKNITEHEYTLVGCDGSVITRTIQDVDKSASAFTIQDAKDGDVLVVNNEVFIYAHRKQMYCIAVAHCFVDIAGDFYIDGEFGYVEYGKTTISPATKEMCDLLFQKMKEEGYEWDAEKKKLKRVYWNKYVKCNPNPPSIYEESGYELDAEKSNEESNEGNCEIDGLYCAKTILEKTLGKVEGYQTDDGILEHKSAINAVTKLCDKISRGTRINWEPSDEQVEAFEHFVRSIGEVTFASPYDSNTKLVYSLLSDLKKIKRKINMNTEVTKEQIDEVLQQCQENINNDDAEYFRSYEEGIKDVIEWLFYDGEKPSIATDY